MIFQNPYASLNPRLRVSEIVGEAPRVHGMIPRGEFDQYVDAQLRRAGLDPAYKRRYPHQFSGGQRQRIGIARALVTHPELVVCDEPVSALDVSIKAQILELLRELKKDLGLTYLFISHDIATLGYLADRIAVMYLGEIVETGPARDVMRSPRHPYTQALMSAVPRVDAQARRQRIILEGELPSSLDPPQGCKFHTRCQSVMPRCATQAPPAVAMNADGSHRASCFLYADVPASDPSGEGQCKH
jgi:oligopeptide/dipeptide ABC transporter ATP-binding protein